MKPATLLRYLLGSREAIMEIASTRWSLAIGAMFVLSAGLARNYDGAYLPAEPTVLLRGFAASVGNSLLLYSLIWGIVALTKRGVPKFLDGYLSFLGLFWMTAPLAWLYAVPYERFLTPVDAIEANAWTLAFVSLWRVALMVWVLTVIFAARLVPVLLVVLCVANAALLAAAIAMPGPIVDMMGGMQYSPEDVLLAEIRTMVHTLSFFAAPVLFIAAAISLAWFRGAWQVQMQSPLRPPRGLLILAAVSVIVWLPVLELVQPEQHHRHTVETLFRAGSVAEAIAEMSRHDRRDFPPVWEAPPRAAYAEPGPPLQEVLAVVSSAPTPEWVRGLYLRKAWIQLAGIPSITDAADAGAVIERACSDYAANASKNPGQVLALRRWVAANDPHLTPGQREALEGSER
ncbi:MAG: hypothetical protein KF745_11700 [Phycisphaeraceae bacterium]|nr:hypothetical protein [Phycisphaeraceae bacterium]